MAPRTTGSLNGAARPAPAIGRYGPAARLRGLTREFGGRRVLDQLDLEIGQGEFVAFIGRSGSGKSTLLRALAGLDREVTGELSVHGAAGPSLTLLTRSSAWTGDARARAGPGGVGRDCRS